MTQPFHIIQDRPWLENQLADSSVGSETLSRTLTLLAEGKKRNADRDVYITASELAWRGFMPGVNREIVKSLKGFFKHEVTAENTEIKDASGNLRETVRNFDDGDDMYTTDPPEDFWPFPFSIAEIKTDLFVAKANDSTAWRHVTPEILTTAEYLLFQFYEYDSIRHVFFPKKSPVDFLSIRDDLRNQNFPPTLDLSERQRAAWNSLNVTTTIPVAALTALYRLAKIFCSTSENSTTIPALSDAVNFGEIRDISDDLVKSSISLKTFFPETPESLRTVLHRLTVSMLTSLLIELKTRHPSEKTFSDQLTLIVTHACHIINLTHGEFGIGVLNHLSAPEWESLFSTEDIAHGVASTLTHVLSESTEHKAQDLALPGKPNLRDQLLHILMSNGSEDRTRFKTVIAVAMLTAYKNTPEVFSEKIPESTFTLGEIVFKQLNTLHFETSGINPYRHGAIIHLTLDALGEISNDTATPENIRHQAFGWCHVFHERFTTFLDVNADTDTQEMQKRHDRLVLLKAQRAMSSLDPEAARKYFFNLLFEPLGTDFDPRRIKWAAHNSYYRRIGAAQQLALLSGHDKLAFQRRLDEENNEWGRVTEKAVRENELFRLEFFKEAYADIDPNALEDINAAMLKFDPNGTLRSNLGFLHILRHLYLNRDLFDPAENPDPRRGLVTIENLDIATILKTSFEPSVYREEAIPFDDWTLKLQENNREFFSTLKSRFLVIPPANRNLALEVLFLEVNEAESYQYYLSPNLGPIAMLDFVGRIRSWTSGYQGRVLTRWQAFFDQEKIRKEKAESPLSYKKPESYFEHYQNAMSYARFEKTILPILKEGETSTGDISLKLSTSEALALLKHFSDTAFTAYLPEWILFIIDYDFYDAKDVLDLTPRIKAFELLAETKFPYDEMYRLFEQKGYLSNPATKQFAEECLKKLPRNNILRPEFDTRSPADIRRKIRRAGEASLDLLPPSYDKTVESLTADTLNPGDYHDYRRHARRLLKTHRPEAIQILLEEALADKTLVFQKNAPLSPLLRGLPGQLLSEKTFEQAIFNIATSSSSTSKGPASLINFSAILIQWAERNRIDLTTVLSDAFSAYEPPEEIRFLQDLVAEKSQELAVIEEKILELKLAQNGDPAELELWIQRQKETSSAKKSLERRRNDAIIELSRNPDFKSRQILFQIISHVYNAIRRQYLREILITGGSETGKLVETYLEEVLIPRKNELLHSSIDDFPSWFKNLKAVQERIEFLSGVLAQMETEWR